MVSALTGFYKMRGGNTVIIGINKLKIGIPIPKNITLRLTPYILHLTSYTLYLTPYKPYPLYLIHFQSSL